MTVLLIIIVVLLYYCTRVLTDWHLERRKNKKERERNMDEMELIMRIEQRLDRIERELHIAERIEAQYNAMEEELWLQNCYGYDAENEELKLKNGKQEE